MVLYQLRFVLLLYITAPSMVLDVHFLFKLLQNQSPRWVLGLRCLLGGHSQKEGEGTGTRGERDEKQEHSLRGAVGFCLFSSLGVYSMSPWGALKNEIDAL